MRIKASPEGIVETIAIRMNLLPVPIAEGVYGMMLSRTIMAGVQLGLFEALGTQKRSVEDLAALLGCSEHGIAILVDVLVGCGYLSKEGDFYSNTSLAKKWLISSSPHYLGNYIKFNYDQWEWWSRVEELIMQGRSLDIHDRLASKEEWQRYIYGMRDIAVLTADEVVDRIPVPRWAKRLLDLAGGHGMYSVAMCRKYPNLRATVFELEETAQIGREIVEREGIADRISYKVGDLEQHEFGHDFDVVFLFNILHHFSPEVNSRTLMKAYEAMNPNGVVVIWEAIKARPRSHSNQLALFLSLNFFIMSRADTYSYEEVKSWLKKAGFRDLKKVELRTAPGVSLIMGRKLDFGD